MGKNTKMIPKKKSQDKVSGFQNLKSILLEYRQVATCPKNYFTSINSTSNTKVASGGITPPAPLEPYPK